MLSLFAHGGTGTGSSLWSQWSADPFVVLALAATAWAFARGRGRRRARVGPPAAFWIALGAIAAALLSPLDALAGDLASAHMVQHLLLVVVAAPLLVWSAPVGALVAGLPSAARPHLQRARRSARAAPWLRPLRRPGAAWLLHAGTLWFWHVPGPYGAALDHDLVHAAEHGTFLVTAVLFWSPVLAVRGPHRASEGYGALLVFTMGMQGVILSLLLVFSARPWYDGYAATTARWGLDHLADQQLAGAIMWVPAGLVYTAIGVALVARWVVASGSRGREPDWPDGALACGPPPRQAIAPTTSTPTM